MRIGAIALVLSGTVSLWATSITVDTNAAGTASYGVYNENAGPFPWSDLGFTAGASISSGGLLVTTGGSTSYNLPTGAVTGSEVFTPGTTTLNLGYTPGWTGSFVSLPGANGNLNSNFVYNIGPISGSDNLFNVPLFAPPTSGNLAPALNAGVGVVPSLVSANGPGVGASLTLSAQAFCPFCVTVASATLGFNIGTRVDQSVTATPIVSYGDLVWYSRSQSLTAADTPTFVPGAANTIADTFTNPGFTSGTFYMNILPDIRLTMPVSSNSDVAVPASISASWDVFGDSGSENWPLGDLFSLGTGNESSTSIPNSMGISSTAFRWRSLTRARPSRFVPHTKPPPPASNPSRSATESPLTLHPISSSQEAAVHRVVTAARTWARSFPETRAAIPSAVRRAAPSSAPALTRSRFRPSPATSSCSESVCCCWPEA
jgi:hypothetical protein